LLLENAFPVLGLRSINLLSLDGLLTVIDTIDNNCVYRQAGGVHQKPLFQLRCQRNCTYQLLVDMLLEDRVQSMKLYKSSRGKEKRIITEATEFFNQDPKKGIEFLKEKKILKSPLDPVDVVAWLRENPRLDKKRIADYICSRKNAAVLDAFVRSFPFGNTRLDDALRMFLEAFRLPGEAAEISMVMQHFAG
ncbi:hypothetical protein WUBG_14653, partial [Wuchereria bancrofti]